MLYPTAISSSFFVNAVLAEEAEFAIADLVVGRSVRSLPNEEAQDLFVSLGACPEDVSIPLEYIVFVFETIQADSSKSQIRLKSATSKLVKLFVLNNLLQKSSSSFSMHDIVR